jgi:beta-lactamase regulating signal transducer with metallopeptidase domain
MIPQIPVDALLWWTIKGSAIAVLAFGATRLLRGKPAAIRHAIWTVAVLAQLFVPVSSRIISAAPLEVTVPVRALEAEVVPAPARVSPAVSGEAQQPARESGLDPGAAAGWLALAGAAFLLFRLAAGTLRVYLISRRSPRVTDGEWLSLVQRYSALLRISRPVTLVESDRVPLPVTWGFIYPTILLPAAARDWPEELRRHVLLHELAHIRRADALTQFGAQLAAAFFWFNPLVWLAVRGMRAEAENACDDYVLRDGERPSVYAGSLVELVHAHAPVPLPAFASLSVGRKSDLEHRVTAITNPRRDSSARRTLFAAATVAAVIVVLPLSAVERAARSAVEIIAPTATGKCRPLVATGFDFNEMSGTLTDRGRTVHYFFLRPQSGRCIEASFSPGTKFTGDDRDLVATPRLEALLRESDGDTDRVVYVTERGGALQRRYLVNGIEMPWDAGAQRWYHGIVPDFIRRTTAGVDDRARRIVEQYGVEGLFDEVARIPSTSIRREYLTALLALRTPEALPRDRFFARAHEALSEFEPDVAQFLAAAARAEGDIDPVREVILGAAATLKKQPERRTVLEALARHRSPEVRLEAIEALDLLDGDVWRRTFLEESIPLYIGGDPSLEAAWLAAAERIVNAVEKRALLTALLRYESSAGMRREIDRLASGIRDPDERALLQQELAKAR